MKDGQRSFALLLAAHGERRESAGNESAAELAAILARRHPAAEVGVGFIKGTPSIGEAIARFAADEIVVYPLFLSDGYFTRVRLQHLLEEAGGLRPGRTIHALPPLGLDPALADLVAEQAIASVRAHDWAPERTLIVLFAHGSTKDAASRAAAERLAEQMAERHCFAGVRIALLEESPSLGEIISNISCPAVVIGLFVGAGMHGGGDAPRLVAGLARSDVIFAGNVGALEGISAVISAAVGRQRADHS